MHTDITDSSNEVTFDAFRVAEYPHLVAATTLLRGEVEVAEELVQTALERAWLRWDRVGVMVSAGE